MKKSIFERRQDARYRRAEKARKDREKGLLQAIRTLEEDRETAVQKADMMQRDLQLLKDKNAALENRLLPLERDYTVREEERKAKNFPAACLFVAYEGGFFYLAYKPLKKLVQVFNARKSFVGKSAEVVSEYEWVKNKALEYLVGEKKYDPAEFKHVLESYAKKVDALESEYATSNDNSLKSRALRFLTTPKSKKALQEDATKLSGELEKILTVVLEYKIEKNDDSSREYLLNVRRLWKRVNNMETELAKSTGIKTETRQIPDTYNDNILFPYDVAVIGGLLPGLLLATTAKIATDMMWDMTWFKPVKFGIKAGYKAYSAAKYVACLPLKIAAYSITFAYDKIRGKNDTTQENR